MSRPTVEVADILRAKANQFCERYRNWLSFQQLKVMRAIAGCPNVHLKLSELGLKDAAWTVDSNRGVVRDAVKGEVGNDDNLTFAHTDLTKDDGWDDADLRRLADRAGAGVAQALRLSTTHEVSLLACDDARIAALNSTFRDKSGPTNVLSWPSVDLAPDHPGGQPDLAEADAELGDIAIAYETCQREAVAAALAFEDHVQHLLIHGLLHLLGYDHIEDDDAALMEALEVRILATLGLANPYGTPSDPMT